LWVQKVQGYLLHPSQANSRVKESSPRRRKIKRKDFILFFKMAVTLKVEKRKK
jgi:hypothetical protein